MPSVFQAISTIFLTVSGPRMNTVGPTDHLLIILELVNLEESGLLSAPLFHPL